MSDKNAYWKEIFGDDIPDDLAGELGIFDLTGQSGEADADTFPLDESLFQPEPEQEQEPAALEKSDTHVLPAEVRDFSEYTGDKYLERSEPEQPEPFDGEFDLGEDIDDGDSDEEEDEDEEGERAIGFAKRRRTGCLGGLMYAVFILGASVILACVAWMVADDVLALNKEERTAEITVTDAVDLDEIAEDLKLNGIIEFKFLFKWFAGVYNAEEKIQPGVYQVSTVDYRAIINSMNQNVGELIEQTVLIPEGKTLAEVFEILEENEISTVEKLEEAAANYEFEHEFLAGLPMGDATRLEGYLFPDTYIFYKQQSAENVLARMLDNFDARMEANDVYDLVEESEYTLHEIVTIASMLEKEAASAEEMPTVASVIVNRLNLPMRLQIDATVQYALNEDEPREVLTNADLQVDSPYNTYEVDGLPYGPISNPGVAAILAALKPESTNYYYYALHVDETHRFFNSQAEHEAFVASEEFAYYGR